VRWRRWTGRWAARQDVGHDVGHGGDDVREQQQLEDLAYQPAADALLAITAKLGQFRGDSPFTTWAYKFVIFEVSAKLSRHLWRHLSVPFRCRGLDRLPDRSGFEPEREAERRDLVTALRRAALAANGYLGHDTTRRS
jgi:DNA-directed RNA polymerase specialized sigma24 family protein